MKNKNRKWIEQKVAFRILDVNGYNLCHSKCNKGTFTILLYEQQFTQLCTFVLFSQLKLVNSRRITSGSFKTLLIITLMILSQPKLWYCLKYCWFHAEEMNFHTSNNSSNREKLLNRRIHFSAATRFTINWNDTRNKNYWEFFIHHTTFFTL